MPSLSRNLGEMYERLFGHFGAQGWWPGETPFEVCVGAILTQNTAWHNVEKAIANLKGAGLLEFEALSRSPDARIAELIRPSGYFNIKTRRLRGFLNAVGKIGGFQTLSKLPDERLREFLLGIPGIGPETADSMLLYAFAKPVFVVDTYTKRILVRHGLVTEEATYFELQELFEGHLPTQADTAATTSHYNEFHALIVMLGKNFCRKSRPACEECPLNQLNGGPQLEGVSF